MNVLITSCAAKVLLVRAFKDGLKPYGGKVFTADVDQYCAAGLASDGHTRVLPTAHPDALTEMLDLCEARRISLIVPSRDGELAFFARYKATFKSHGVDVHVCEPDVLLTCQEKDRFAAALRKNNLPPIPEVDPASADYPIFVRPITGAAGRGAEKIFTPAQLANHTQYGPLLYHPFVEAPEFSIDVLMTLCGTSALQAVVRRREVVIAGESKVTSIVSHPKLEALAERLGEALGLVGHNTVQAFDDVERGLMFIEVNPRFGGASNCSIQGGLDSPARIIGMVRGDETALKPRPIRTGLTMYRYSDDIFHEG
jgi:carbamoyl-phosphate synthase large subunit